LPEELDGLFGTQLGHGQFAEAEVGPGGLVVGLQGGPVKGLSLRKSPAAVLDLSAEGQGLGTLRGCSKPGFQFLDAIGEEKIGVGDGRRRLGGRELPLLQDKESYGPPNPENPEKCG
jgi:hypothetical protein